MAEDLAAQKQGNFPRPRSEVCRKVAEEQAAQTPLLWRTERDDICLYRVRRPQSLHEGFSILQIVER